MGSRPFFRGDNLRRRSVRQSGDPILPAMQDTKNRDVVAPSVEMTM